MYGIDSTLTFKTNARSLGSCRDIDLYLCSCTHLNSGAQDGHSPSRKSRQLGIKGTCKLSYSFYYTIGEIFILSQQNCTEYLVKLIPTVS